MGSRMQRKELMLIGGSDMRCITVGKIDNSQAVLPSVFELELPGVDMPKEAIWFAAESPDSLSKWLKAVEDARIDWRKTINLRTLRAMRLRMRSVRREYDETKAECQRQFEGRLC